MVDASEMIPEGGIPLIDAFEYVFRAMTPNWQELEDQLADPAIQLRHMEADAERREANRRAWAAYDDAQLKANEWLRSCIGEGLIASFVSFDGKPLQLPRHGWENAGFLQNSIGSSFVGPDDLTDPGPDTEINGVRRPVYFVRSDLVALVEETIIGAAAAQTTSEQPTKMVPARHMSERASREKFKEWRETRGDNLPSEKEDIAHMKQFGVGRDSVRALRKDAPRLSPGRPAKANKIRG
jgi:hypothetical protein